MKLGELCAGYGGLGLAVEEVFGAETAWFSEFDAAPSAILKHHWPTAPNHGDMTKINWAAIEQVDIISGGTPCQDLSAAGRRAGMNEGTRSNLWVQMREAIAIQKPKWVVWENVRGAFSACASSEMGQCQGCMDGRGPHRPFLRALGRVLGDLSDLGYDTQWRGLRASDVGACHARFRVFVLARRRDVGVPRYSNVSDVERRRTAGWANADPQQSTRTDRSPSDGHRAEATQDANLPISSEWRLAASGQAQSGRARADAGGRDRTPPAEGNGYVSNSTPWWAETTTNATGARRAAGQDRGAGSSDEIPGLRGIESERTGGERTHEATPDASGDGWLGRPDHEGEGRLSGIGSEEVHHPIDGSAPRSTPDAESLGWGEGWTESERLKRRFDAPLSSDTNWGEYELAIRRWERTIGRAAPRPTEPTGRNNGQRLSPRFTEFMMGLPDGWVTDPAIGISRNEQLKACGNGVVPQQAIAALRDMLAAFRTLEAAA